jgi:hypothetical protein
MFKYFVFWTAQKIQTSMLVYLYFQIYKFYEILLFFVYTCVYIFSNLQIHEIFLLIKIYMFVGYIIDYVYIYFHNFLKTINREPETLRFYTKKKTWHEKKMEVLIYREQRQCSVRHKNISIICKIWYFHLTKKTYNMLHEKLLLPFSFFVSIMLDLRTYFYRMKPTGLRVRC